MGPLVPSLFLSVALFAKNDPDRLQSEEYRYETARMQMIATKEFGRPVPANELPLADPVPNLPEHDTSDRDDQLAQTNLDEERAS